MGLFKANPSPPDGGDLFKRWDLTPQELASIIESNPSLRGMVFGYAAELKLEKIHLKGNAKITDIVKPDDHDRKKKGDRVILYKNEAFKLESKSLQTSMVERTAPGRYRGKAQVDASDRRKVRLPNGDEIETTCLLVGEFDVLAVNIFAFESKWRFVFARNRDLPRTTHYKPKQNEHLLATLVPVTWPPEPPFREEPFSILDEILADRAQGV